MHMMGHYAEPPLDLQLQESDPPHVVYVFSFDPLTGEWKRLEDGATAMVEDDGEKEKVPDDGDGKEKEKGREKGDGMEIDADAPRIRVKVGTLVTTGKPPNPG
jgi:hypothetical protein